MKIISLNFIAIILFSTSSMCADLIVNTADDLIDLNPGDGICEATLSMNDCSLRAAIMETNALLSADSITLPAGVFNLSLVGDDQSAMVGDLDVISGELIIQGHSKTSSIIDGNGIDRIFEFNDSDITLKNLTLRNGGNFSSTVLGGAINASGQNSNQLLIFDVDFENNRANAGGALYLGFEITVTLINSSLTNNTTTPLGITNNFGPAIFCSKCNLHITNSTISHNHFGGKSIRIEQGSLTMLNSTVSNNDEGGIRTTNADALIKSSTFVENASQDLSHFSFDGTKFLTVGSSILQNSTNNNCQSGHLPISLGYNILSDDSCQFSMTGDIELIDAELGDLLNNGGTTKTHHPAATSVVINHIPVTDCLDLAGNALITDQRGQSRPFDTDCDVGAVEANDGIIFINGFE